MYPNPFNETTCEATTGNEWHEGTVYDHRPGNNTVTLTPRTGGAGLAGASASLTQAAMTLNWPAATGASEYRVFRSADGTTGSYRQIAKVKATTYTDAPVTADATYYYHVDALYPDYRLAEIYTISTTATQPPASPMAPGNVSRPTATRKSGDATTINVSWTAPSDATAATRYDVEYQYLEPGASSWTAWSSLSDEQTATTYTLSNAGGGTTYRIQVRGVNLMGEDSHPGNWSPYATVNSLPAPNPVAKPSAIRESNDDTKINVTWIAPVNATGDTVPTHYDVQYEANGNGVWLSKSSDQPVDRQAATALLTYQVTSTQGINGNNSYRFRVRTVAVQGNDVLGDWVESNTVPKMTAPTRVGPVTATRNSATNIAVTWTEPSSGATGYHVQRKVDGGAWDTTNQVDATSPYTFDTAVGNSGYQFRVRAYVSLTSGTVLTGDWRESNILRGLPPGNITSVTGTRSTSDPTEIIVNWSALSRANTYDVQYRPKNGSWRSAVTGETGTSYTVSGLSAVTTYQFRVRGVNGNGNSDWTESGDVTPLPLQYNGVDVYVDYLTLKVTSGPWWYKYLAHDGWTSCAQVAAGGHHTIRNLIPEYPYRVDLFKTSACDWNDSSDFFQKVQVTMLSDITDWGQCYETDDCRSIDNPNDFNNHTHKRRFLGKLGETTSGCDWNSRVQHNHGWPSGHGPHWHCDTR